jgi:hypothetical protein
LCLTVTKHVYKKMFVRYKCFENRIGLASSTPVRSRTGPCAGPNKLEKLWDIWVRFIVKYEACNGLCSILQESHNTFDVKIEEIKVWYLHFSFLNRKEDWWFTQEGCLFLFYIVKTVCELERCFHQSSSLVNHRNHLLEQNPSIFSIPV